MEGATEWGGGQFLSYAAWILKKKGQVLVRSYMTPIFALFLGLLTIYREREALIGMYRHWHISEHLWLATIVVVVLVVICLLIRYWSGTEFLMLILTGAALTAVGVSVFLKNTEILVPTLTGVTIVAAAWELFGNKLTTSPQEIRFLSAMRSLLRSLQELTYGEDNRDLGQRVDDFLQRFLDITSRTLCGKTPVDAGYMREVLKEMKLELYASSTSAQYPPQLSIPIVEINEDELDTTTIGPANIAYSRLAIVYMPFKRKKLAWPFKRRGGAYQPSEPKLGWVKASAPQFERFCSVLSLPVAVYRSKGKKRLFGILNYSTKKRDPFVDRDFAMSECFSSILAQALEAVRRKAISEGEPSPEQLE